MSDARDPTFYLEQASYVRALARRVVFDPHAADDLFQAAWLAALQRPARDGGTPRRWLARIVRNLASKAFLSARRRQRREQQWEPPPSSSPADVVAHEHERQRVVAALLALDEPYRATLIARFFDGLEPAAIAARDGVPVETVRTRQKRALQQVRERLLRGGGSAVALVHGLRLDAPDLWMLCGRLGRGLFLMQATKKIVLALGLAMVAAFAWWAQGPAAVAPRAAAASDAAPPAVVALPAPAAAGAGEPSVERRPAAAPATGEGTGSLAVLVQWPDRRPAADLAVRVGRRAAPNFEASVVRARTDRDGWARFDRLTAGDVMVACDRGSQQECTIRVGERTEARLVIAAGVTVRGRVLDLDGRAAAGAEIYLLFQFLDHAGDVVARAAMDGSFTITEAPAGRTFALSAWLPQRAPTAQQMVTSDAGAVVDVELRFTARGGAVVGRVVDDHGGPVLGAVVLVGPDDAYGLRRATGDGEAPPVRNRRADNDAHGEWRIDGVAAGDTPVTVVASGMAPWQGKVFVIENGTVRCDAVMSRAARLIGSVCDEHGAAVPRATVRVGAWGLRSANTSTAVDGTFALEGLPLERFTAVAQADGLGEVRAEFTGEAGVTLRWDAVLSRGSTLRGRVVAAGAGVANARVSARCMPSAMQQWFGDTTSGADGTFEFTNCPDALLHVEARRRGAENFVVAQRDDVEARAGDVVLECDPSREATAFVAGRVLAPDGKPVVGAEVTVLAATFDGGHFVRSEADGRFRSPPCPPGDWYLTVRASGFAQLGSPRRTLAAGATTDWGDLVLTTGRSVLVTLQPEAGLDLDGLVVGLADANVGIVNDRPEHGVVRWTNIGPGDYTLTAYARGAAHRPIPLHVGEAPETAIVLPVVAGSEVSVDVRDELGQPMLDRLETELLDGSRVCIDRSPLLPGSEPMRWQRRLVADRYELRLRDHRGRVVEVPLVVVAGGAAVQAVARFR